MAIDRRRVLVPAHPTRRPSLETACLIGSCLAVSNVPQPGDCISEHTRTALPSTKPSGHPAMSLPSLFTKQTSNQDSSLSFHLALELVRSLSPHDSAVSTPFAFYPSISQSHCKSLPLQPLRHSLTFLWQLSPSYVLVQLFAQHCNSTQPCTIFNVLPTGCLDYHPLFLFGTRATLKEDLQVPRSVL